MGLFGRFEKRDALPVDPVAKAQEEANWISLNDNAKYRSSELEALADTAVDHCVSSISATLSGLPLDLYTIDDKGKRVELPKKQWMIQPNINEPRIDTFKTMWISTLLTGNGIFLLMRNPVTDEIEQMEVISSDRVEPYKDNGMVKYTIDGDKKLNGEEIINGRNILHIKNNSLPGEYWGLSPIDLHARTINASLKAEELSTEMFHKGLMSSGALIYDKLGDGEVTRINKQLQANNSVKGNTGKLMIFSGNPKLEKLQISPADMQFQDQKMYMDIQIARIYKFPPYKLNPNVTTTWGSGIQEQNQNYVDTTLKPWIDLFEAAINTYLVEPGQYVKFNLDAILRGDIDARYDSYGKAIYAGIMTPNQARELEDMEVTDADGGNSLQIPLSQTNRVLQEQKLLLEIEEQKIKNDILRKQLGDNNTGGIK